MQRLKENRIASYIVIAIVYAIAATGGVLVYRGLAISLGLHWWPSLLVADVAATVLVFIFSLIFKNASVYDPYWSVQPAVILIAIQIGRPVSVYSALLLGTVLLWALRLTANWAYTFKGLAHEDWRYRMLRERTGRLYPLVNFFGIHMVPTFIVFACTLPAAYIVRRSLEAGPLSYPLLAISLIAIALQTVADIQMHIYRKDENPHKLPFMRRGLWRHSRHPNYLAEILMWWGVGLSAIAAFPMHWYLLAGAVGNTLLFLLISIPMADYRQSKKKDYKQYRASTRMLLPIPRPKRRRK